jgi:hypothetical protein
MVVYIYYKTATANSISTQLGSQGNRYGTKRQAVRPVQYVQNHTCWVTLLQPARRAAVLGQPSSLRSQCLELSDKLKNGTKRMPPLYGRYREKVDPELSVYDSLSVYDKLMHAGEYVWEFNKSPVQHVM